MLMSIGEMSVGTKADWAVRQRKKSGLLVFLDAWTIKAQENAY